METKAEHKLGYLGGENMAVSGEQEVYKRMVWEMEGLKG